MKKVHQPPYYDPAKAPVFRYFRMAETYPGIEWWRPLAVGGVALVCYLVFAAVVGVPLALAAEHIQPGLFDALLDESTPQTLTHPLMLLIFAVTALPVFPAAYIAMQVAGRPAGTLMSVQGRFRWRLFGRYLIVAAAITVPITALLVIFDPIAHDRFTVPGPGEAILLGVLMVLVPFQAAAEEIAARGLLGQLIGSWLAHPVWPILLPVPLLILGSSYVLVSQVDIAIFAVGAGFVTWATGGLEAAIALRAVFYVVFYGLASFDLLVPNSLDGGSLTQLLVATIIIVVFATLVVTHHDARTYPNHARAQPGALDGRIVTASGWRGPVGPVRDREPPQ